MQRRILYTKFNSVKDRKDINEGVYCPSYGQDQPSQTFPFPTKTPEKQLTTYDKQCYQIVYKLTKAQKIQQQPEGTATSIDLFLVHLLNNNMYLALDIFGE